MDSVEEASLLHLDDRLSKDGWPRMLQLCRVVDGKLQWQR